MRRFDIHSFAHACSQTFLSSFTDDVLTRHFNKTDKYAGVQSCVRKKNRREKDGGHTWKRQERREKNNNVTRTVREVGGIDDVKRELSRLSRSMLIQEGVWRVNFRWHRLPAAPPAPPWRLSAVTAGVHTATDSRDNFHKPLRISVSTFSVRHGW